MVGFVLDLLYLMDWKRVRRALAEICVVLLLFTGLVLMLTWPTILHMDEILLGGGELGGWRWREWWHFEEIESIQNSELGFFTTLGMLVGLGRFPETGNILDIILLSYPLEQWFGWPMNHNLKVLIILIGNGICGYALARSFTDSKIIGLVGGTVAILNPLVIQDINKLGLRQVLLWWLLLYPVFLRKAQKTGTMRDGILAATMFVLTSAFYWFYGLFAGMMTVVHVVGWWWKERPKRSRITSWGIPFAITSFVGILIFVSPYLDSGTEGSGQGGTTALPEVTFFQAFPAYETIAEAPLRPQNPRENVLSSLHRTIDSAWPADYIVNVGHGAKAWPVLVTICGILPAFFIRRARTWVVIWTLFYVGTLGPWLKIGARQDTSEVVMFGEHVVRLPYTLMFQVVPGMSRMFAPYRMASMVVVASIVLVAISLGSLKPKYRKVGSLLVLLGILIQPFYRFDLDTVEQGSDGPEMWRIPMAVSPFTLPDWYADLDPNGKEGIIELPLEQQQDLICAYQSFHQQKVYRSWATAPAIPTEFRRAGGGAAANRLRWLARDEPNSDALRPVLMELTRNANTAELCQFTDEDLIFLMESGSYRWMVIHERGFYLTPPDVSEVEDGRDIVAHTMEGLLRYETAVRKIQERLGIDGDQSIEIQSWEWPGMRRDYSVCEQVEGEVVVPAWVPWSSQEVNLGACQMPESYRMHVFDLHDWRERVVIDSVCGSSPPDGARPEEEAALDSEVSNEAPPEAVESRDSEPTQDSTGEQVGRAEP